MAEIAASGAERRRFGLSLPLVFGLFFYTRILAIGGGVLVDPDTYWHIAVGRWIIAHGAVPHSDPFSFTMPGAPWTTPEWLSEVLIAEIHDHFGWAGLVATTALCVAGALALLVRELLRSLPPIYAMIATALAWDFAQLHLLARPHMFTLPILVVWVAALVQARSAGRAPSLRVVPLMTLWANLHGSFMLGIGIAALLAGEAVLIAGDRATRLRATREWAIFGACSIAAALVTPIGIEGLLLPFTLTAPSFALSALQEWQSPNFQEIQPVELWIMAILAGAFSFGWRLPPIRVAIVLLLLHMALQHLRYGEALGFAAPLLLAPSLGRYLKERSGGRVASLLDRVVASLAKPATGAGVALAGVVLLAVSATLLGSDIGKDRGTITPAAALAATSGQGIEGPVFNDYDFGGYLIFRGIKPFIDGRYFYGDAFTRRYVEALVAKDGQLPQLLAQYGITWTLLRPSRPAVALLDHLPGWRRLYADDIAVVHLREDSGR
jgi:hypothetical protein